jgi:hypothetical protein
MSTVHEIEQAIRGLELEDLAALRDWFAAFERMIDESGEDYLYPAGHFVAVDLPQAAVDV